MYIEDLVQTYIGSMFAPSVSVIPSEPWLVNSVGYVPM